MADAPRSILAWLGGPHQGLSFAGGPSGKEIEYIRADVARANAELAVAEVQRLRTERDALRAAVETLRFYADEGYDGYNICITDYGLSTEDGPIIEDAGERARATLAKLRAHLGETE